MLKHLGRILAALLLIGSAHGQGLGIGAGIDDVPPPYAASGSVGPPACVPFGPGCPGFLSNTSSTFAIQNQILQSQAFTTSPWATANLGAGTLPTVTANTQIAPDSTMTASTLAMPAVTGGAGSGNASILYQPITLNYSYPLIFDLYVKGAVGGETLYISESPTGAPPYNRAAITATTSWQRFSFGPFYPGGQNVSGASISDFIEIGTDLRDTGQSNTPAETVYIWGAQLIGSYQERTYIPTTTVAVTQNQVVPLPAGIAFRDFSSLAKYSGNPILPQNTGSYNAGGVGAPWFEPWAKISGTLYSFADCTAVGFTFDNQCLYTGTDVLHWTDHAGNPAITNSAGTWFDHYLVKGSWAPACTLATYCYYLSAMDNTNNWSIGIFTASSPTGPWTNYSGNPVIASNQIANFPHPGLPTIQQVGSATYMYTAYGNNLGVDIGVFQRSTDTSWLFVGAALLPALATDWDASAGGTIDPWVFKNKHGFYEMVYTAEISGTQSLGYAISADGLTWFKYQSAPILTYTFGCSGVSGGVNFAGDGVFNEDGTNFYLLASCANVSTVAVGMAFTLTDY